MKTSDQRKTYNKLVRDRIPEIIAASGKQAEVEILDEAKFRSALLAKLVEEAQEVQGAAPEELATELADLLEVVQTLAQVSGLTMDKISSLQEQRHRERGGFAKRILLRSTDEKNGVVVHCCRDTDR